MATGSVYNTYQTPVTCDVCERSEDVDWYCQECKGNMCTTCKSNHKLTRISKNHNIVPIFEGLRKQLSEEKCKSHPAYICSWHCNDCQVLVCTKCITTEHKGHHICEILDAIENVQKEIEEYHKLLETRYLPKCKAEETRIRQNLAKCHTRITSCKMNINKQREELKHEIDQLCDGLLSKTEDEHQHLSMQSEKTLQKLQDTVKEIDQLMTTSKDILSNLVSEQISFNKEKPSITQFDIQPAPTMQLTTFLPGKVDKEQMSKQIGKLVCPGQTPDDVLPVTEPVIDVQSIQRHDLGIMIADIFAVNTNKAWVRGNTGETLKLVNTEGQVMKSIGTKSDRYHFVVISTGDIMVTDYTEKCIRIMTPTGQVTRTINTKPYNPTGICISKNNQDIVVCANTSSNSKLVVYSRDGKELHTITYTDVPVKRYLIQRVSQNGSGDYCVAHHDQQVVYGLDYNGVLQFTYDGSNVKNAEFRFYPRNICHDIYNHLFISDFDNHNIHMLNGEGQFLRSLLTAQDGIYLPSGLSIDHHGKLWVGQLKGVLCVVDYLK